MVSLIKLLLDQSNLRKIELSISPWSVDPFVGFHTESLLGEI